MCKVSKIFILTKQVSYADKIEEEDDEQSITEMIPEVASNVDLYTDETFTICQDTLKLKPGQSGDFLSASD